MKGNSTSDVKSRILHEAKGLFITNGYAGTSIREIAKASGANVAHIKYYFDSKAKLFEIIFDEAFEIMVARIHATLDSDLPFMEMIDNWIDIYFDILPEYPMIPIFILNEINQRHDTLANKIISKKPYKIFNRLSERMQDEIDKGAIRDIPVLDFGLNILSLCVFPFMFTGFATQITHRSEKEYNVWIRNHKEHIKDFVKNALRP